MEGAVFEVTACTSRGFGSGRRDKVAEIRRLRRGLARVTEERTILKMNRPLFTGERLVQILACFFMWVQDFIEHLLCVMRRDKSGGAVQALGVVPIDPLQRFPIKLAH